MKNKPFAIKGARNYFTEQRSMQSGATEIHNSRRCHLLCSLNIYLKELSNKVSPPQLKDKQEVLQGAKWLETLKKDD